MLLAVDRNPWIATARIVCLDLIAIYNPLGILVIKGDCKADSSSYKCVGRLNVCLIAWVQSGLKVRAAEVKNQLKGRAVDYGDSSIEKESTNGEFLVFFSVLNINKIRSIGDLLSQSESSKG